MTTRFDHAWQVSSPSSPAAGPDGTRRAGAGGGREVLSPSLSPPPLALPLSLSRGSCAAAPPWGGAGLLPGGPWESPSPPLTLRARAVCSSEREGVMGERRERDSKLLLCSQGCCTGHRDGWYAISRSNSINRYRQIQLQSFTTSILQQASRKQPETCISNSLELVF